MNLASPSLWGGVLVLAGALALYAAAPNQLLLKRRAGKLAGYAGLAVLLAGLAVLLSWAGPGTAVFIFLTLAMLAWTVVPLAAAWLRSRKGAA